MFWKRNALLFLRLRYSDLEAKIYIKWNNKPKIVIGGAFPWGSNTVNLPASCKGYFDILEAADGAFKVLVTHAELPDKFNELDSLGLGSDVFVKSVGFPMVLGDLLCNDGEYDDPTTWNIN